MNLNLGLIEEDMIDNIKSASIHIVDTLKDSMPMDISVDESNDFFFKCLNLYFVLNLLTKLLLLF